MRHNPLKLLHLGLLTAACLVEVSPLAQAQEFERQKLIPPDAEDHDQTGFAAAVRGDLLLIGSRLDDDQALDAGAAYVYRRDRRTGQWEAEDKLVASDGVMHDWFGMKLAIDTDLAAVGVRENDTLGRASGAAYLYEFDPSTRRWPQIAKLLASDGVELDLFGWSISISGEVVLVGAPGDDDRGRNSGSAYVFRRDPASDRWVEEEKLLAPDGADDDRFGSAVVLRGQLAVVGAPLDDDRGQDSGSVHVFRYDPNAGTWRHEDKLLALDGEAFDQLGSSLDLSGDAIVAGAHTDDDLGRDSGAAYVFRFDGPSGRWPEEQKLIASDGAIDDHFGWDLGINGDWILVTSPFDDDTCDPPDPFCDSGSAYAFRYDAQQRIWREENKLFAKDAQKIDYFGHAAAVSDRHLLIGARLNDENGPNAGASYVFEWDSIAFRLRVNPDPPQVGSVARFTASGGTAFVETRLAFSPLGLGSQRFKKRQLLFDLKKPLLVGPPVVADFQGSASWAFAIPAKLAGRDVWLQAAQAGLKTDVLIRRIP